MQIKVPAPTER